MPRWHGSGDYGLIGVRLDEAEGATPGSLILAFTNSANRTVIRQEIPDEVYP